MRDLQQIFEECLEEVKLLNIHVGDIKDIEWIEIDNAWGNAIENGRTIILNIILGFQLSFHLKIST